MVKRFTPKASDYTDRLASVQAHIRALRKEIALLEAEEAAIKAYVMPFYALGATEVTLANESKLMVNYGVTPRTYLDQEKARLLLAKAGKKAPEFSVDITTFSVKAIK